MSLLNEFDPEISRAVKEEEKRQRQVINLIASENYASRAVLEAEGSVLTNKYAEGYPGRRYYGGCENMDTVETLAIERAKQVFKAGHANVQSHSGSQANMAAYYALIEYGDTVLSMSLAHGGHLTHGDKVSFSGKSYGFVYYGVDRETERIDFDEVESQARKHRPKLIVVGASAYPRIIDFEKFRLIADMVGAGIVADIAHIAGLVAVGLHPSPVPYSDVVTSTTHKTMRGPRGGFVLCGEALAQKIDSAVFPKTQGGPFMHSIAAKAVAFREAMQPAFLDYQRSVLENTRVLGTELQNLGLRLVSGGTDNHLVLVDLTSENIMGIDAQRALERSGIVSNRNRIPFDTRPAWQASGIRFGAAAVTSRGFGTDEMKMVAELIVKVIRQAGNEAAEKEVRREVDSICSRFPVPGLDC